MQKASKSTRTDKNNNKKTTYFVDKTFSKIIILLQNHIYLTTKIKFIFKKGSLQICGI